jgi:hypothetical protein
VISLCPPKAIKRYFAEHIGQYIHRKPAAMLGINGGSLQYLDVIRDAQFLEVRDRAHMDVLRVEPGIR